MARELTGRQEAFCHHYAAHGVAARAAREAGYAAQQAAGQGSRLAKNPRLKARIAEVSERLNSQVEGDADAAKAELVSKLQVVFERALAKDHLGVAVRAVEAQGRILGLSRLRLPALGDNGAADEADMDDLMARPQATLDSADCSEGGAEEVEPTCS